MTQTSPVSDSKIYCNRCQSEPVQVSQVVELLSNYKTPTTTTKFRCSNDECQNEADRKMAEAVMRREQQIKAKAQRTEQRAEQKLAKI